MLMNSVIPIVNDNDLLHAQVAEFSDNDQLAACLAGMLSAEMVVFLSNVSGVLVQSEGSDVFEGPITTNDEFSKLLSLLWKSHDGHGGMISKVRAAKLLFDLGIESVIGSGRSETPIQASLDCTMKGTRFQPNSDKRMKGVRKWLCAGAIPKGVIVVSDLGAEVIVSTTERGSLLAAGIVNVSGSFEKEDVVSVCTQDNRLLGYGISRFASDEIPAIVNQKGVVVIHADYFYGTQFGFAGNGHDSDG
jgi:glutamate 5-kinase